MQNNKHLEDILELTPDMLEQISGGAVTDRAQIILDALIKALKKDETQTHTPESLIEFVTSQLMDNVNLEGVTEQDVADYVNSHWD
ncbi:MAG: hypothetical protein J6T26_00550 [Firmicutes bacterium]|nr:hypothetical protein [Bacillota bacterium]